MRLTQCFLTREALLLKGHEIIRWEVHDNVKNNRISLKNYLTIILNNGYYMILQNIFNNYLDDAKYVIQFLYLTINIWRYRTIRQIYLSNQ